MKILLMSDTHGELEETRKIIKKCSDVDMSIHLGDIGFSLKELANFHVVCGNHDTEISSPKELVLTLQDRKVLCIHGNVFDDETIQEVLALPNVKNEDIMEICMNTFYKNISKYALQKGCDTVFFGHSHHSFTGIVHDVVLINPGSLCYTTPPSSYAIVDIQGKEIHTEIYECTDESIVES